MKEMKVSEEVKRFAEEWTFTFMKDNPQWYRTHEGYDDWNSKGAYDLNLYICDGCLTTTAYLLVDDGSGYLTADTMSYETLLTLESNLK